MAIATGPVLSDDGHVLFATFAGNLTGDFANSQISALVVRDLQSSELRVASRRPDGYHRCGSDQLQLSRNVP